jgi:hypothetical protein
MERLALAVAALGLRIALMAATAVVTTPQTTFATPEEATAALVKAAEQFDTAALGKILGPDGLNLVVTEDAVQDKNQSAAFAAKAKEKSLVVRDAKNPKKATVVIGTDEWPMPIPIVQKDGRWSFDSKSGRQEILFRRIGANELDAIEVCRGFVEAQNDYAEQHRTAAGVPYYAQKIISSPGERMPSECVV